MITKFKLFEFYRGPYKAIGFKHYQELGFGLIIITNEQGIEDFENVQTTFISHMKRLGSDVGIDINKESSVIALSFPAVNKHEAFSIIEQINTYFSNKKIFIQRALMISDIEKYLKDSQKNSQDEEGIELPNEAFQDAVDVTKYIKRKEDIKAMFGSKIVKNMGKAYKSTKIGF